MAFKDLLQDVWPVGKHRRFLKEADARRVEVRKFAAKVGRKISEETEWEFSGLLLGVRPSEEFGAGAVEQFEVSKQEVGERIFGSVRVDTLALEVAFGVVNAADVTPFNVRGDLFQGPAE